ncbi:MAG: hypothetical protein U9O56_08005 [Campylobacterota bacterium]|nr:hypothetical protein [Campylobacterota bacterium]
MFKSEYFIPFEMLLSISLSNSSHRVELEGESMRKIKSNIDTNYE